MSILKVQEIQHTNGTSAVTISTSGSLDVNGKELILDADADTSITADTDDRIDFKTGGTDAMHIDGSQNVGIGTTTINDQLVVNSSSAEEGITVRGGGYDALKVGLVNPGTSNDGVIGMKISNGLRFITNDTERMRIDSSGHVKIGNTANAEVSGDNLVVGTGSGDNGMTIYSGTSDAANIYFSDGTSGNAMSAGYIRYFHGDDSLRIHVNVSERLRINSSGRLFCDGVYDATTGAGANVNVDSNGHIQRSTSSQRYKNTIVDAAHGLTELMNLRSVTYKHNSNGDKIFGGLIAEEVHAAGLTEFVEYSEDENGDDRPEALHYGNMVSLCIKAIQDLKTDLDAEKAKTATLQTQVADLTTRVAALEA